MKSIFNRFLLAFTITSAPNLESQAQGILAHATIPAENTPSSEAITFTWTKTFSYEGITEQCRKLIKAYPDLVKMESIGESASGRRIWALTITNQSLGNVHAKPGFLVEGNTLHEAGVGSEHALYLAWHLSKSYASDSAVARLLDQKVIYVIPVTFPDTKETRNPARQYVASLDDDNDGRADGDGPEDITNDGVISLMRRKAANGAYTTDQDNPLKLKLAAPGTGGQYEWLGYEGFDNDRDGQVNEDPMGYQAIDRDWAWKWQPAYGQTGSSSTYPFSIPENRALKDFITKHPNIAAAQIQYRKSDAVFLGLSKNNLEKASLNELPKTEDERWLDQVLNSQKWKWLKYARGVHTFPVPILQPIERPLASPQDSTFNAVEPQDSVQNKYHEWTPFEHPTFGPIEIGGLQIYPNDLPEGDFLQKDLEHFARQTIKNARQLPQLVVQNIEKKVLADGLIQITASIFNAGSLATHTLEDLLHRLERADYITLKEGVILASGLVGGKGLVQSNKAQQPSRVELNSIPGNTALQVRWIVKPTGPTFLLEIDSRKGGVVSTRF